MSLTAWQCDFINEMQIYLIDTGLLDVKAKEKTIKEFENINRGNF